MTMLAHSLRCGISIYIYKRLGNAYHVFKEGAQNLPESALIALKKEIKSTGRDIIIILAERRKQRLDEEENSGV